MPFKNSCFISYRHPKYHFQARIVEELYEGLRSELELLDETVFIDKDGLQGGEFYNEALALELYNSVCLVVIYTPAYFSTEHPYCSREYRGMEELEQERIALLTSEEEKLKGLIIPIVFRGFERMSAGIKGIRQCHDFSNFLASDEVLYKHHLYTPEIKDVAQYISDRCAAFNSLNPDPWASQGVGYELPKADDIEPWITQMLSKPPNFPGREDADGD